MRVVRFDDERQMKRLLGFGAMKIRTRVRAGAGYNVTNFILDIDGEMGGYLSK